MDTSREGDIYPNRNDSKSFCMCVLNKPVSIKCPDGGSFNPYTRKCTKYELSVSFFFQCNHNTRQFYVIYLLITFKTECDQSKCNLSNNNTIFDPTVKDNGKGFCRCVEGIATYVLCNYDSTYDSKYKTCKLKEV